MGKLIATDLDGTLFYPKDKVEMIHKPNLFFLQSFIDDGGEVVIISGRSYKYCLKVINKIGRPCQAISYNGACVYDGKKLIYSNSIPNQEAKEIIKDIFETYKNPGVFLMTERGLFIHLIYKSKLIRKGYELYYKNLKIYAEDLFPNEEDYEKELENGQIYKIMIFFGLGKKKKEKASNANKIIRNVYENVECNWSDNVIEITAKNCSKANALKELVAREGLNHDDVYVVGDSGNDISMFKAFPEHSFCMGHSPQSVRKNAKYTIEKFEFLSRYIYEK